MQGTERLHHSTRVHLAGEPLYRSSTDAWIFGLCGGIAKRFKISPLVVRLLCVLFAWTLVVPLTYIAAGFTVHSDILAD